MPSSTATFTDMFGNDEDLPTARLISSSSTEPDHDCSGSFPPDCGYIVEDAIAVPSQDDISSAIQMIHDRSIIHQATRRGRMLAELELEEIQRANGNVRAQNYFAKAAVNEANRLAHNCVQLENLNTNTTSVPVDTSSIKPVSPQAAAPIPGPFGQEYDVSCYNVKEYTTKDYDVSDYKSVYER